ncbi:MAG: choice-of-anchor A family protein [Polyangiaceae bacterium]|nr:choice-of-anchor A family protein [Polyangiaceae bacterium]
MRLLIGLSAGILSLLVLLTPFRALADEAHSWCIPGPPKNPSGSPNPQVNQIVGWVCSQDGFDDCCAPAGKWSVSCIQKASRHAFDELGQDTCGRFAWAQGPVSGTQQRYPRDFALVAVGGAVSGLADVEGPVASKGLASAASFSLNSARRDAVALIAQGGISFNNGTVYGNVHYAGSYNTNGRSVTYINGLPPTGPSDPFPMDFTIAKTKLQGMSAALFQYPTTPGASVSKEYSTLKFTGTDPVLNVFSVSSALFRNTYTYSFDVPPESTVIVNVSGGATIAVQNAGFTDGNGQLLRRSNMLWNFPATTTLTIQSVGFPGSILAPYAAATLRWSNIEGTVVVWSATVSAELHFHPFRFPGCAGCLCLDADWSCSDDTVLTDAGDPATLEHEAGFLFIPGGEYHAENTKREVPDHRIWYSFQPADVMPKTKPLAVFFNGGPGAATSAMLFSFNTGPVKLVDPTGDATSLIPVSNSHSWTQFANLLYIDAPVTGFSYPLPHEGNDNEKKDVGTDIDEDAGVFLRVITQFLLRHPALLGNRVILVAESYGGTRASLMLKYLYEYPSLTTGAYRNPRLHTDLLTYFSKAYNTEQPSQGTIAQTFGHQVLINAVVAGSLQTDASPSHWPSPEICIPPADIPDPKRPTECWKPWYTSGGEYVPATCDSLNCNKPIINGIEWGWQMSDLAAQHLTSVSTLNQMLGVDATTIEWMKASARAEAFGRDQAYSQTPIQSPTPEWLSTFGALSGPTDNYYIVQNDRVNDSYGCLRDFGGTILCTADPPYARTYTAAGVDVGEAFVMNMYRLSATLITVTKYDYAVPTQAIIDALNEGSISNVRPCQPGQDPFTCGAYYNPTYPTACSLPGFMQVALTPMGGQSYPYVKASMPTSYDAGHSVTMQDGDRFRADVQAWFEWPGFSF